jgi:autotransporter passenger strand-loop-strand repeat protein
MGRDEKGGINNQLGPLDLFRYSAPGKRELVANNGTSADPTPTLGYFSIDGGKTSVGGGWFNNVANGTDFADWAPAPVAIGPTTDIFGNASSAPKFTLQDLYEMHVLGWNIANNDVGQGIVPSGFTDWVGPATVGGTALANLGEAGTALENLGNNKSVEGVLEIASGGSAGNSHILSGGLLTVDAGGSATDMWIYGGGAATVDAGGTASSMAVYAGGHENVQGTDVNATIYGWQAVSAGGLATSATLHGDKSLFDGVQRVLDGAAANNTIIDQLGRQIVDGTGWSNSTVINSGGEEIVDNSPSSPNVLGGAYFTKVSSGGTLDVISEGRAVGTTVSSLGSETVEGRDVGAAIHGGVQDVSSGGIAISATVDGLGGRQTVEAGGTAQSTKLGVLGFQVVEGTASGTVVGGLAELDVKGNGIVSGSVIDSGGYMDVGGRVLWWGAQAYDTTVEAGGTETVSGFDFRAKVYGSQTIDSGGWVSGTTIHGGTQNVTSGGIAVGSTVDSGGHQEVYGTASGTVVSAGGTVDVMANGVASGDVIDGGRFIMHAGSVMGDTAFTFGSHGGTLDLYQPASTVAVTGNGNVGTIDLYSAHVAITGDNELAVNFSSGADNVVDLSNTDSYSNTIVNVNGFHGTVNLYNASTTVVGAMTENVNFQAGSGDGVSLWNTGGQTDTVTGSYGHITLTNAYAAVVGTGDMVTFSSGTNIASLWNTGSGWDSVYGSNGTIYMYSANVTFFGSKYTINLQTAADYAALYNTGTGLNGDTINGSNDTIDLYNATATITGSNNIVNLKSGSNTVTFSGGPYNTVNLSNNGSNSETIDVTGYVYQTANLTNASATILGGIETINLTGANTLDLRNTGVQTDGVWGSNATVTLTNARAAIVGDNDIINFSSGTNVANLWNTGSAGDTLTDSNGANDSTSSVNLFNAMVTLGSAYAGTVDFYTSTGTLRLENSSSFAGTVAGLSGQDAIDFADIGFGANSTLGYAENSDHSGGTLSVGDGAHMANIALLGSYMASTFAAASDGHGGTLISEATQTSTQTPIVTQPHM